MLERTMRSRSGMEAEARVTAGRTRAAVVSQPDTGRSRRRTAKRRMSMMPVQNTGMEVPRNTTKGAAWAGSGVRRGAGRKPEGGAAGGGEGQEGEGEEQ